MSLKANYEFLFVGRDDSSFLENYYYDLFQDHGEKSGQIFINIEVQNSPVYAEELGARIFQQMIDSFFADVDKEPYKRFESALKDVNRVVEEFKSEKKTDFVGNIHAIVACIVGGQLILTQCGESEAYLIRKRYVSVISEGLNEDDGKLFSSIASGDIEAGDFVLFSSTRLLRYVSKTDLASCVHKKSIVQSLDDVRDLIYTEILGRVGMTGILFSKMPKSEEEVIRDQIDEVNKGVLAATKGKTFSKRETLVGKFSSFVGKMKNRSKSKMTSRSKRFWELKGSWFEAFKDNLFSKGMSKEKVFAVLLVLILFLFISVFLVKGNAAERERLRELSAVLDSVSEKIDEANTKGEYDKEVAANLLDLAYNDAKMVLDSGEFREKVPALLMQIEESRDRLENVLRLDNPEVLLDLNELGVDPSVKGFVVLGERLFIHDASSLYEILVDKLVDPVLIDEDENLIAATGFDARNSVVFLSDAGRLLEWRNDTVSFMDTEDQTFRKGVDIDDWGSRIYILDSEEGQIWKYTYNGAQQAFGSAAPYLTDGAEVLAGASALAIDGSIYALSNSELKKMYAGENQEFFINDAPDNFFKSPVQLFTDEKLVSVFLLDRAESRVIILDKERSGNLVYNSQYVVKGMGELRDLYVDADTKQLYILTDSKVLKVGV